MNRTVTLALAMLLASCSDGMPTTRERLGSPNTANTVVTKDGVVALSSEQRLRDLQAKDSAEVLELANLRDINQKLCERLVQLRNECPSTYRLLPTLGDQTLACAGGNVAGASLVSGSFQVDFGGDGREYRILADNNWESNAFANGSTAITWKPRLPTSTQAPRLLDMTQIRILPKDGQAVSGSVSFSLKVNGIEAINPSDVTPAAESNGYFMVSMQRITGLRDSPSCKFTMQDLNVIVEQVRAASAASATK